MTPTPDRSAPSPTGPHSAARRRAPGTGRKVVAGIAAASACLAAGATTALAVERLAGAADRPSVTSTEAESAGTTSATPDPDDRGSFLDDADGGAWDDDGDGSSGSGSSTSEIPSAPSPRATPSRPDSSSGAS